MKSSVAIENPLEARYSWMHFKILHFIKRNDETRSVCPMFAMNKERLIFFIMHKGQKLVDHLI